MDIFFNICEHTACHLPKPTTVTEKRPVRPGRYGTYCFYTKRFMRYSSIIDITTFTTSSVLGLEK